jgi:TPR repeat protein
LQARANAGDALAQNNLGNLYDDGKGVPHDYAQAAIWYRKAAEQGLAEGQYNLGLLYTEGRGLPQDDVQAAQWYRKAAEQGIARAQYVLGALYSLGKGVPQDYAESYFWLDIAVSGRLAGIKPEDAIKFRDTMAAQLTPSTLSQVQEHASKWFAGHPASR